MFLINIYFIYIIYMSDSEEEREMIRNHKLAGKKTSALLKKESHEAGVRAMERVRLKRIEHDKERNLALYAKSILKNIKDVQDIYKIIKSGKITTEKDVDKFIKQNNYELISTKPKSDKSKTIKKIKDLMKDINTISNLKDNL